MTIVCLFVLLSVLGFICMLILVSPRFPVLGEVSFCTRTLPNRYGNDLKELQSFLIFTITLNWYCAIACNVLNDYHDYLVNIFFFTVDNVNFQTSSNT